MDMLAGFYLGCLFTLLLVAWSAAYRYVDRTEGWDHKPTHDEIGQKILESYILPDRD
jgi:hypothetical protein